MQNASRVAAMILAIIDVALITCLVMLFIFSGNSSSSDTSEIQARESAAEFVAGGEDLQPIEESMVNSGMITASYSGTIATPTPTLAATPTPTPTPSETPTADVVADMQDSDFIFPNSSTTVLTEEELQTLSDKSSCQRAINEIYARHGYQFHEDKNPEDYAYFNSLSWYQAMPKTDSMEEVRASFNSVELENEAALSSYESSNGWA